MVLIPNDAGIRMRMQTEASLQPIAPVSEIPAELVELRPGQAFSARIQEVLPENTYKALVAGRSLTLALPQGAKAGDTLELVVVDRTPRLIVAQLTSRSNQADLATPGNTQFANLSRTAQLIGSLLTRDGTPPPPAALTRGQPLLAAASTDAGKLAAQLAPQLAKAVGQSGLFYESHQVQWVMGQRPMTDLLTEPQARFSPPSALPLGPKAGSESSPLASSARMAVALPALGQDADRVAAATTSTAAPSRPMVLPQNQFGSVEIRPQNSAQTATITNPGQTVRQDPGPPGQAQSNTDLPQLLTKIISQNGLIYEAHQVPLVMEQRAPSGLLVGPQATHSPQETPAARGQESNAAVMPQTLRAPPEERSGSLALPQSRVDNGETRQQTGAQSTATSSVPAQAVPAELRPLVQQQLDAAATQRLAWHGDVWPGQSLDWRIEPDDHRTGAGPAEIERGWITSLRLITPRLGLVDARLSLTSQGARIIIATPTDSSAADLQNAAPSLEKSMAAAGIPLLALQVRHVTGE